MRRPSHAALAAVVAAAALVACGDEGEEPPPTAIGGVTQQAVDPAGLGEATVVATLTREALSRAAADRGWAAFAGTPRCDVTLHAILHPTVGPDGGATRVSGAVLVPGGDGCDGPRPVLSYSRGTDLDRDRTLADADDRETQALATFFAANGYVVVASDYLGYARSTFPYHPYLHASSEARTTIDALRAGRALLARLGIPESGRVFVAGYSQGGHAALAAQRAIERDRPAGVALTAVGAMSGPYDLAGTFVDGAAVVPALLLDLADSALADAVEVRLGDVLQASALDLLRDRDRLREVLQANSVIGWRPQAPVMLCGGSRDPIVPFSNTRRAAADFESRGATVAVVDVDDEPAYASLLPPDGAGLDELGAYHQGAVPPACFAAVRDRWFEPRR